MIIVDIGEEPNSEGLPPPLKQRYTINYMAKIMHANNIQNTFYSFLLIFQSSI